MEVRYASEPGDFKSYDTRRIRESFLVQNLFVPGRAVFTYSHYDRMIVGGVCPRTPLPLEGGKALGTSYFLERRELGIVNVGPEGSVSVDGKRYLLNKTDALYVGQGAREVEFSSAGEENPAKFYLLSGPAHRSYPTAKIRMADAQTARLGTPEEANVRVLNKYIHGEGVKSCQLVMGITALEAGSVWNSMPCHTHERRMEVYFYFDLSPGAVLFHFMGKPDQTRHIVVRNEEAVISPPWSIHAGSGTSNYTFIWGMLGDNQTFQDMDGVKPAEMR
jgi:4-deoxy-L-threo-5-hexosulose-uronate ketol-isomerase